MDITFLRNLLVYLVTQYTRGFLSFIMFIFTF